MIWKKVASGMTFSTGAAGADKDWPLAVQDWGLQVKEVIYAIFSCSQTANVEIGALHKEGPNPDSNYFVTHSTAIALAVPAAAAPILIKGKTDAAAGPLMPYFTPVVRVGSTGASVESFTGDVYVGGKPF